MSKQTIIEVVQDVIGCNDLISEGTSVVVGVSGGADSVALLHVLHALGIPLTIAHVNHNLRGEASELDEQFVRALAQKLNLPIKVCSVDVEALASAAGISIEMAARQARHEFFASFSDATIALAHHADDQVETFLLKLVRGAGTAGLSGMAVSQQIGSLSIIRPLLTCSRADLIAWLQENQVEWRDDASNQDERFLRNRMRHTLLPLLEESFNPQIRKTILRTMNVLQEEDRWMDSLLESESLHAKQPLAAKRRLLRKWLFEQGVESIGFEAVEQILAQMAAGEGSSVFELSDQHRIVIEYGIPRLETSPFEQDVQQWTLKVEKSIGWKPDRVDGIGSLPATAYFDADKVGASRIEVRSIRAGDRMAPLGMTGTRKLQDILTDQKVPRFQRSNLPVVVCRDEIIWLPGYRIARGWELGRADAPSVAVCIDKSLTD